MIQEKDSLEFLKEQKDFSIDINYSDPPYALGSEIVIDKDGKPNYKKAVDFMNKWEMPSAEFWEQWFKEAYRTCKYGGYVIMFGIDRQLLLFKYYSALAGFVEKQSLYWYFISNFPKASDLSKNLDKNAGAEREKIKVEGNKNNEVLAITSGIMDNNIPITPLAKKYSGYKYSIAPLKQTCETIMVFQKPYKTGSCMHDTLAYENGDKECCCGALDIDGNRVGTEILPEGKRGNAVNTKFQSGVITFEREGRYPSQTFCDSQVAEILDNQSGISKGSDVKRNRTHTSPLFGMPNDNTPEYSNIGGCSKILHKCDFEKGKHDLYIYNPKVSSEERNAGCEEMEDKEGGHRNASGRVIGGTRSMEGDAYFSIKMKNNHPTLKPISLNKKILKLFKTPNPQKIIYPFAGSGSEVIGGIKAGFGDWSGCEINPEYIKIANARIKEMKTTNNIKIVDGEVKKGLEVWGL
jgi:DNA modification methylase